MAKSTTRQRRVWDNLGTAVLAVILSMVVWVNATHQNDRPREGYLAESVPIQVQNVPPGLVVSNAPDEYVRVKIKALESSWAPPTAQSF